MNKIVLGGGCFWCIEAFLGELRGVVSVTPGYAGGTTVDPTYQQVCAGIGNHAQVVEVTYDPTVLPLQTVLEVFFSVHDPTTLNRQAYDVGPQYRSCIYYNPEDRTTVATALKQAQNLWDSPIVTEIGPLTTFYETEAYHHDYFANNPERAYCQIIINPKLSEIRKKFKQLMR